MTTLNFQDAPFCQMRRDDSGKEHFFGYGPDFMEMLSEIGGFSYSLTMVKDGRYAEH